MKWIAILIGTMLIIEARTISLLALLPQYQINQTIEIMGVISLVIGLFLVIVGTKRTNWVKLGV